MLTFLVRRLIASFLVLLAASFIVYVLAANAGDPLEELRTSTAKNKETLIAQKIDQLDLDVPPPLRYFLWLSGLLKVFIGQFDLGESANGRPVTVLVASAIGVTIQLLISATVISIVVGITIGITTALRQYSSYDYSVTFLSFLFFSLPSFFVAVILKQYVGIGFNDFLRDPVFSGVAVVVVALLAGIIWLGIIGGSARRRITTFVIAAGVTALVMLFLGLTDWFNDPGLGIGVIAVVGIGAAFLVTALTSGLGNRKALYAALTAAVAGIALYYPFIAISNSLSLWSVILVGIVVVAGGYVIGLLFGGEDRSVSARAGALTALIVALLSMVDRYMQSWNAYSSSSIINGRPIGTIGAGTPGLDGVTSSFWVLGLDSFTHLLLPTSALLLISLASYSRYSRASLLEVMNQDYIRTARAKGLSERTVVMRHAFRNALIPITTIVAFDVGALIGGAVITENVFAWSGMGRLFSNALRAVDVNSLMGFFIVTGAVAVTFNLLADLAYSALDPRIRVGS